MKRPLYQRPSTICPSVIALFFSIAAALLFVSGHPVAAQGGSNEEVNGLSISVNMTTISVSESDYFNFHTIITNNGTEATQPLVAHLNVASLQKGVYVDPEDWSELRTKFVDPIAPGASVNLSWRVHALFAGNFAVYVVVLSRDTSSIPVVSDEIHVHIEKWEVMQLTDVNPIVTAVPVMIGVLYVGQKSWLVINRRRADEQKSLPENEK